MGTEFLGFTKCIWLKYLTIQSVLSVQSGIYRTHNDNIFKTSTELPNYFIHLCCFLRCWCEIAADTLWGKKEEKKQSIHTKTFMNWIISTVSAEVRFKTNVIICIFWATKHLSVAITNFAHIKKDIFFSTELIHQVFHLKGDALFLKDWLKWAYKTGLLLFFLIELQKIFLKLLNILKQLWKRIQSFFFKLSFSFFLSFAMDFYFT